MPVVMMAQLELIMHTRVLRPMTRAVLRSLEDLVVENKPQHWLTIYLTMFILLHCCSILTRREWELAMQCGFMVFFFFLFFCRLSFISSRLNPSWN